MLYMLLSFIAKTTSVIPAQAGIHKFFCYKCRKSHWIPACAGMTGLWDSSNFKL